MYLWLALWVAMAWAVDDVEPESQPPPDDGAAVEVIVFGNLQVEQAKQEVYTDLRESGYTEQVRKDDHTIFRHLDPYKGEVHVYDDGWVRVKRQKFKFEGRAMPWAEKNTPFAWAGCVIWLPLCVRPGGQTMSKRRFRGYETRIVDEVQPEVGEWGERIADLSTDEKVQELPFKLELLWNEGRPLNDGDPLLVSYADRRQAILTYWGARTDTQWGEAVRSAVESFCRGVIQGSEHPFTDEEIASFNAQFTLHRPFTLERQRVVIP
ncbi:MAG: hypothetical protein GWP91_20060 [Rhodobacterales bacterium]|nr:hypothetical protein [Rhodobacterales bacterium]